ncbi:MAG: prolyl oligopeptidase family serine peptidase [Thermaerobacter sp.]|nr:prolyl oligopeptidase family serine peptidase [Thermaerobacter sp.]
MANIAYPATPVAPVTDVLHGVSIVDPYRWLEDGTSAETTAWVAHQNALTREVLDGLPVRAQIKARWLKLAHAGSVGAPRMVGEHLYYLERSPEERQPRLMRRIHGTGAPELVLDPNADHEAGLVALDWYQPSRDGTRVAYGLSANGDEWSTLYVRDLVRGETLPVAIPRCRMSSVAWLADGQSFFYTRYPLEGTVPESELPYHKRVYWHNLGATDQEYRQDPEVFGAGRDRRHSPHVDITDDGRYLVITMMMGTQQNEIWWADLAASFPTPAFQALFVNLVARFHVGITGHQLDVWTNWEAPNGRMLRADLDQAPRGAEAAVEVVAEHPRRALQHAVRLGDGWLLDYLEDASSRLVLIAEPGGAPQDVALPELGTISAMAVDGATRQAFVGYESFAIRPGIWQVSLAEGRIIPHLTVPEEVPAPPIRVTQEWTRSADGTPVPLFIVQRADQAGAGLRPTVLSGYGGFNLSRTPTYSHEQRLWVELGGVFAVATLRGGGEYGAAWHRAGMLEQKQHTFDDYLAAADHLVSQGHTDRRHLALWGRSNGGLLVGAALTQRPDVCRAVVCGVPLLDMVRYHQFLIADLWTAEYGSADDPAQFAYIYAYSPYHHVEPGTAYPAVLFYAAHGDSRVDPLHARKMAALMQNATTSDRPILLRIEFQAGHGVGKPIPKQAEEYADILSFLADQLALGRGH